MAEKKSGKGKRQATKTGAAKGRSSATATASQSDTKNPREGDEGYLVNARSNALPTIERPFLVEYFPSHWQILEEEWIRKEELSWRRKQAERVLRHHKKKWLKKREVTGLSVGYRTKFGQIVSPLQIVIDIDVDKKYLKQDLPAEKRACLPSVAFIDRTSGPFIPVKVRERNYVNSIAVLSAGTAGNKFSTANEITGGIQIAPESDVSSWGTLGICVPHVSNGTTVLVAITNHHVAGGITNVRIRNPAGAGPDSLYFGVVSNTALNSNIDAASIVNLATNGRKFNSGIIKSGIDVADSVKYFKNENLTDSIDLRKFQEIFKVGAKTGERLIGSIQNRSRPLYVKGLTTNFKNVIEVKGISTNPVTDAGDSGSVLVGRLQSGNEYVVLGLNFAMSEDRTSTFAIPFGRVITRLKVDGVPLQIPGTFLWP
jgi:hypothetical protein